MKKLVLISLISILFLSVLVLASVSTEQTVNFINNTYNALGLNSSILSFTAKVYNSTYVTTLNNNTGTGVISDAYQYSANQTGNETTISFWVYVNSFNFIGQSRTAEYTNFLAKTTYDPSNNMEWDFRMENSSGHDSTDARPCRFSFYAFNKTGGLGSGSYFQDNSTADSCPALNNTWLHIVGRMNGTHVSIWKNGVMRDTDPLSGYGILPQDTASPIHFGNDIDGGQWNGSLDDLRIYNRSLLTNEIQYLTAIGRDGSYIQENIYNQTYVNLSQSTQSYISTPININTANFTIAGWFYREDNNSLHTLAGQPNGGGMLLRLQKTNALWFYPASSGSAYAFILPLINRTWTHFALTYNNNTLNTTLYINGLPNSSQIITNTFNYSGGNLLIGKWGASTTDTWNGSLDEFRVYNKLLNTSDVLEIYNNGLRLNRSSTVSNQIGYYNFEQSPYGYNLTDSSGNGNDGTAYNLIYGNDNIIIGYRNTSLNLTDSLAGQWMFNENLGTTFYDKSKYANNGTLYSMAYANDGVSLNLSNVTDYDINLTNGSFRLINSAYNYQYINISYTYNTTEAVTTPEDTGDGTGQGGGGSGIPPIMNNITNLSISIRSNEICRDIKGFLSNKAVSGLTFNEIPTKEINAFIKEEAGKYKLNQDLIHNYVYNYPLRCYDVYPSPAFIWLRNNYIALLILALIIYVVYQGIKKW